MLGLLCAGHMGFARLPALRVGGGGGLQLSAGQGHVLSVASICVCSCAGDCFMWRSCWCALAVLVQQSAGQGGWRTQSVWVAGCLLWHCSCHCSTILHLLIVHHTIKCPHILQPVFRFCRKLAHIAPINCQFDLAYGSRTRLCAMHGGCVEGPVTSWPVACCVRQLACTDTAAWRLVMCLVSWSASHCGSPPCFKRQSFVGHSLAARLHRPGPAKWGKQWLLLQCRAAQCVPKALPSLEQRV